MSSCWPLDPSRENAFVATMLDLEPTCPFPTPSSSSSSIDSSHTSWEVLTTMLQTRSVLRCETCKRRFHSKGNLANHHQLYRH
ncbi:hypothetical protein VTP01DRAFT_10894 [Rhizomucor pusillus]|uniref:uncharacterized protein n=1 Tax=Rhizomucor pusillus TaxID=4840 RepID=UPI00374325F3